jgi:hypothetical protein
MNTKPSVKVIKKDEEGKVPEPQAKVELSIDPNRWSKAVQSWVSEFQKHRRGEILPAFDGLFK